MKTELRKTYFCEHCKRHMLSAGSMARHEKYCRNNPENKHKCFDLCAHLKRDRVAYGEYGRTEFTCELTGVKMHSYLLEKKASLLPYHRILNGLTRMPLECNKHERMTFGEQEKRFSPVSNIDYEWF